MIKNVKAGYKVVSSKEKNLGGPHKTLEAATLEKENVAEYSYLLERKKLAPRPRFEKTGYCYLPFFWPMLSLENWLTAVCAACSHTAPVGVLNGR